MPLVLDFGLQVHYPPFPAERAPVFQVFWAFAEFRGRSIVRLRQIRIQIILPNGAKPTETG